MTTALHAGRRDLLLLALIVLTSAAALAGGYLASQALAARVTQAHALNLARDFTNSLAESLGLADDADRFLAPAEMENDPVLQFARRIAHLERMLIIGADQTIRYDSDGTLTGAVYDRPYIRDLFNHGEAVVKFADDDDLTAHDADDGPVAEAYVPLVKKGRVVGIFELYLDVADQMTAAKAVLRAAYLAYSIAVFAATGAATALVYRSLRRRRAAMRELQALRDAAEDARRKVEQAMAQQKRFTNNAAHELRTPLAVLRARIDGAPPFPERDALLRDVERMTRLVGQMLAAARLEARQVTLTDGVDLTAAARETVGRLFPAALAQDRFIALEAPDAPVLVRGDAFALEDALRNLIENALRFTPPGGAADVIVADSAAGATLTVADRGPGVAPDLRDRLFEPFSRGADRSGGAGLGLSIVAETAAIHGASVAADDRPGGGAVFTIRFPK